MGKRKFAFLFLSVFIVLFSIGCSRSSGYPVGKIDPPRIPPPGPGPDPPPCCSPPGDPHFDFYPPFASPGRGISPQFIVGNLPGYPVVVSLYKGPLPGSRCEDPNLILIKKEVASRSEVIFSDLDNIIPAQDGIYRFFVKVERDHFSSVCLDLTYILDTTAPRVVANTLDKDPLRNDNTPMRSKTWSWACDDLTSCKYRWFIDDTPLTGESCRSHVFSSVHPYSDLFQATKTGGQGRYCIHIQARDQAGIESSVTSVYATLDNGNPSISQVSVPSGTYAGGDQIDVTVAFNETVVVTGTPRIAMTFDGGGQSQTKYAEYYSGSDSRELVFRYTVVRTDSDSDGIGMANSLELPSGSGVNDEAGNALDSLSFTLPANLNQVKVDGDGANVIISETDLEVGENGGTGTYTVKLNKAPSHPVTVRINNGNNSRIVGISHAFLTFRTDNWGTLQTVTLTGVNDNIDNDVGGNPQQTISITHTVTSSDTEYNNMEVPSVEVTSLDDDEIGTIELSVNPDRVNEKDETSTNSQANNRELVTVVARFQGGQSGGQPNRLVQLSDDLVLSVSVRPGTAQVADFNSVSNFNLRISSGSVQGTGTFNLTVVDDEVDEVHETIEVRGSTPLGLEVDSTFLTIIDNDGAGVVVSGLQNDEIPVKSKTWNWSCAGGSPVNTGTRLIPLQYREQIVGLTLFQVRILIQMFPQPLKVTVTENIVFMSRPEMKLSLNPQ